MLLFFGRAITCAVNEKESAFSLFCKIRETILDLVYLAVNLFNRHIFDESHIFLGDSEAIGDISGVYCDLFGLF